LYPASFEGTYLWHIPTDTKTLLSDNPCGFIFVHWDYERGQMLGLQPADINPAWCSYTVYSTTVQAHDLQTGTLVRSYSNPSLGYISLYTYTPDMRYIIVFPREGMEGNAFTIWDRDTGLGVRAAMNWPFVGAPQTSPDMRYVAVGGYRKVRIWNIENLEADPQPRDPLYRLEVPMEIDWRWISPTVIEIISFRGTEYFDVASGTYIDAP
jgi:WD40 repeat protein